jgi:dihydroxy-acid dehydratase
MVVFDIEGRRLDVELSEEKLSRRLMAWSPPRPRYDRGVLAKYARGVASASLGAITSATAGSRV